MPCEGYDAPLFSVTSWLRIGRSEMREVMGMPKAELTVIVEPRCQRLADQMGFELVDVSLDKEPAGRYLRLYIDKPAGITLDDCEAYHRAIQPQLEDYDYDFLEVSSPGIDRPLKKDRDFERAIGSVVEVKLFKAMDGAKQLQGVLADFDRAEIALDVNGERKAIPRKAIAVCRMVVDMEGVESVELPE